MIQLSISAACAYVRKVMDELISVEEIGLLVSPDAVDLHKLVENSIIEAAVKIHNLAPSVMIDGIKGVAGTDYELELNDSVITIKMKKDVIRIASVQASDSEVVVSDLIPEDSAEGRKQLNEHVRGIPDDPRLVLAKVWEGDYRPKLKYYTTQAEEPQVELHYVPYPEVEETIILICPKLEYAVLNEIAAMVLDILNEHGKADIYRQKALAFMEGK